MTIIETMDPDDRMAIFFDIMDTLVYNPFFKEIPAFFGVTHEELLRRKHPTSWIEFERGTIPEAEYFRRMFADGSRFDEARFRTCVAAAYRWVDGMEDCLAEIHRAGNRIHALSNYPSWYRTIEEKLRLSRYLQWTSVSCNTGVRKPAPEAFLGAANLAGRPPENCLLIDDSAENCAGAAAVGMRAIRFRGAGELRRELAGLGLLPATRTV
jgi:HAD superfamily hydrolase (TIGR01509 family)